jgi:competence protein ComEC
MDGEIAEVAIRATGYSWQTDYGIAADGTMELTGREYKVRFYVNEDRMLKPGDLVRMRARLRLTDEGGAEEPTFHRTSGILLLAYPKGEAQVQEQAGTWRDLPANWSHRLTQIIAESFPADTFAFAKALLLGDKSDLSWSQSGIFSRSGISHIVAVSGLHVSILFALIYTLSGKMRFTAAIFGIPMLILFACVAGLSPSIVRACIMQSVMILALLFRREYDPPSALATAVIVILFANPFSVVSVSFQLSCGCIVGIFLFSARFLLTISINF